jgi:cadmium resistance protein CadD (predicted permease)
MSNGTGDQANDQATPPTPAQAARKQQFQLLQSVNLGLLVVLAGLLVAFLLGQPIPKLLIVGLLGLNALVRTVRDLRFGSPAAQRRVWFNLALSAVLIYLLLVQQ